MSDKISWPAWRYGPDGASDVFEHEKDVPPGWVDHPSKVKEATAAPKPNATPKPTTDTGTQDTAELDADGWPWSPELHSATKTKTQAGLWRMKVGASRPEPKPGYPKPAQPLDL